jgi:hypothetical protein
MRATLDGQTPAEIRRAIDATYTRGVPMPTPRPPAP